MNHKFLASQLNVIECSICHKDMMAHTDEATCECCKNVGPVTLMYGNMLMCASCIELEKKTSEANNTPAKQQSRIDSMNVALSVARNIDDAIEVKTDIFNAETVAITEIQQSIASDDSIVNKPYALAEILTNRFNHFKSVIFDLNKEIVDAGNKQKAIQVYLNNLANQLRAEERDKLKISDINYKPSPSVIKKPKAVKVGGSKKIDKVELRKYASELGVSEHIIQLLVISKGISVEDAANQLRKSINEAKSESVK